MDKYKTGSITFIKFMTKEELISFITDVHNFKIKTKDGRVLKSHRTYVKSYQGFFDPVNIKLCSLDYLDVLMEGSGYVRYHGYIDGRGPNRELVHLFKHYGFEVEL